MSAADYGRGYGWGADVPSVHPTHSRQVRRLRAPRPLTVAIAFGVVVYAVWSLSAPSLLSGTNAIIDYSVLIAANALVPVATWRAGRRSGDQRTASAWYWLTAAYVSLMVSSIAYLSYQAADGAIPFPGIPDVFILIFYPLLLVGILRMPRRSEHNGGLRLLVDALIIFLGAGSVIWFLVLGPTVTSGDPNLLRSAVSTIYPIGNLLQIFALVHLLLRGVAPATRRSLHFFVAGIVFANSGNLLFGWATLHGHLELAAHAHLPWVIAGLFYILAAVSQQRVVDDETVIAEDDQLGATAWLPYVAPVIAFGLLVNAQFGGTRFDRISLAVIAVVIAALVLLRQYVARRDLLSAQGQLSHRALHDALTELPNRALVLDRAAQLLARARRLDTPIVALYLDVDGFKHVNDSFGHAAGDELLKVVAARLQGVVRESDTVGRMGGDEFVVLLDPSSTNVSPELVAERITTVLRQPIDLEDAGGRPVFVTASIGIATGQNTTADDLLRNADLALYEAKAAGKDRFVAFELQMQTAVEDRLLLELDLRDAIDTEALFLVYQPTFDLRTETVSGVEALIRWRHPSRGLIAPDAFIPLAEQVGLILPIGRWVLHQACTQAAIWHGRGQRIGMSVNISARQLDEDDIVEDVRAALEDSGLDPGSLTLEITETTLMRDADATARRLHALKALGIRIAIDDFGTGYSSLAYLRQFPVDALKIDRSFISGVAGAAGTDQSAALIHTLIQLGKSMQIETLGEGIEEQSQLRQLQREQCDSGQGFLLARPLELEAMEAFLDSVSPAPVNHSQAGIVDGIAGQPSMIPSNCQ